MAEKSLFIMTNPKPILNQVSAEPLYSLSKIEKVCHKDPVFIRKMTDLFIQQLPIAVKDIRSSFENKDYTTMKAVAHRIKPTLDNMCVSSLFNVIREIESFPDHPYSPEKLELNIRQVEETMEKIITDLKMIVKGTSN
jgi:two-component system, sensor histidine kinase